MRTTISIDIGGPSRRKCEPSRGRKAQPCSQQHLIVRRLDRRRASGIRKPSAWDQFLVEESIGCIDRCTDHRIPINRKVVLQVVRADAHRQRHRIQRRIIKAKERKGVVIGKRTTDHIVILIRIDAGADRDRMRDVRPEDRIRRRDRNRLGDRLNT